LDRDGTLTLEYSIHGKSYPVQFAGRVAILPGISDALSVLKSYGFKLIVVTNQPNVARGITSVTQVEQLHKALLIDLPDIDEIFTCYHDDRDHCTCRKPKPGLLFEAAEEYGLDLSQCYMVGNSWRDVEAGQNAGCWSVLIDQEYDASDGGSGADIAFASLIGFTRWIVDTSDY